MNFKDASIEEHGKTVKPTSLLRLSLLLKNGQSEAGWEQQNLSPGKDKVGTHWLQNTRPLPTFYLCIKTNTYFNFTYTTEDFWVNSEAYHNLHLHYKALRFAFLVCSKLKM